MIQISMLFVFPILMAYAAASDLLTMTIPNKLSLILIVSFFIYAFAAGLSWPVMGMHAAAFASVLAVTFFMFSMGWIGGGDAKLASSIALWFGFEHLMEYFFIAAIGGGALTLAILFLRGQHLPRFVLGWQWLTRLHDKNNGVPYGIALAGAALLLYPQSPIWTSIFAH
jgi:prepilin peptidase CpaA